MNPIITRILPRAARCWVFWFFLGLLMSSRPFSSQDDRSGWVFSRTCFFGSDWGTIFFSSHSCANITLPFLFLRTLYLLFFLWCFFFFVFLFVCFFLFFGGFFFFFFFFFFVFYSLFHIVFTKINMRRLSGRLTMALTREICCCFSRDIPGRHFFLLFFVTKSFLLFCGIPIDLRHPWQGEYISVASFDFFSDGWFNSGVPMYNLFPFLLVRFDSL